MTNRHRSAACAIAAILTLTSLPGAALGQGPGVVAQAARVHPSTLNAVAFEWPIEGDPNRLASVRVDYRKVGESAWTRGPDAFRLAKERLVDTGAPPNSVYPFTYTTPDMFTGSIFELEPGTRYELRLTVDHPNGVRGNKAATLIASTRADPAPSTGRATYHVYPPDYKGTKQEPSFTGILGAYYMGAGHGDWSNTFPTRVQPGDTILVHAGTYKDDRFRYGGQAGMGSAFDGTYYLTAKGTQEHPITIRAAGDGEVIFDGDGNHILFNVMAADHHYFEGITVQNTDIGFLAGIHSIAGSVGLTVRRSQFNNVGRGIITEWGGSRDYTITDNRFIGRHDPSYLVGWMGAVWKDQRGFPAPVNSDAAVKLYGSGHVISYNAVQGFHDGLALATYGRPQTGSDAMLPFGPSSIDIIGNDISNISDNCIEADGALYNVRVIENRCFNIADRALSAQPTFAGPIYFLRNFIYHAPSGGALKLHASAVGVLAYHNTFVGEIKSMGPTSNVHYRNNVVIGGRSGDPVFSADTFTSYSSSDYNAFELGSGKANFSWRAPVQATQDYEGERPWQHFPSLEAFADATGQDRHSKLIDFTDFEALVRPDPADPSRLYSPAGVDPRPRQTSAIVDAALPIPGINDQFVGKGPDMGAFEAGGELPHYGPRP